MIKTPPLGFYNLTGLRNGRGTCTQNLSCILLSVFNGKFLNMDIYSIQGIKQILLSKNYFLSKSRGQNYLINKNLAYRIVDMVYSKMEFKASFDVVEVGSGLGAITIPLLEKFSKVLSIEIDKGIFNLLVDIVGYYGHSDRFEGVNSDFLKLCPKEVLDRISENYIFVSNLPYNAGGEILRKMYYEYTTEYVFVMVQREFFERLISKPGEKNYSFLSVIFQLNSEIIEKLIEVKNVNFFPIPSVDSVFVFLKKKKNLLETSIVASIQRLFSTRRKNILNSLAMCFDVEKKFVEEVLEALRINKDVRVEELLPEEILDLVMKVSNNLNFKGKKT